jgi:hypothetical protein
MGVIGRRIAASPVSVGVCVYGLDLLWAFMLDNIGSAAPVDAIEEATELFVSLLLYLDGKLIMSPSFPGGVGTPFPFASELLLVLRGTHWWVR